MSRVVYNNWQDYLDSPAFKDRQRQMAHPIRLATDGQVSSHQKAVERRESVTAPSLAFTSLTSSMIANLDPFNLPSDPNRGDHKRQKAKKHRGDRRPEPSLSRNDRSAFGKSSLNPGSFRRYEPPTRSERQSYAKLSGVSPIRNTHGGNSVNYRNSTYSDVRRLSPPKNRRHPSSRSRSPRVLHRSRTPPIRRRDKVSHRGGRSRSPLRNVEERFGRPPNRNKPKHRQRAARQNARRTSLPKRYDGGPSANYIPVAKDGYLVKSWQFNRDRGDKQMQMGTEQFNKYDTNEAVKMESAIGQRRSSQSAEELPDWYYAFYGRNN